MKATIRNKAAKIKLLILDVDGVLTDNKLYIDDRGREMKAFNFHDGYGIKALLHHGVTVAVISGNKNMATIKRMCGLGVKREYIFLGSLEKLAAFAKLKKKLRLTNEQIAYVGDDMPDFPVMEQVGFSCAVKGAVAAIKKIADYVTKEQGGNGAVREVCELLIAAQS